MCVYVLGFSLDGVFKIAVTIWMALQTPFAKKVFWHSPLSRKR